MTITSTDEIIENWVNVAADLQARLLKSNIEPIEARNKALEDAAKVAESQTDYTTVTPFVHRERVAAAIRALKGE